VKEPSLLVEGLSVIYSNGHKALDNASFSIPRQSITALVGINGSGKSTLFKAIMGFVKSSGGRIELFGGSVKDALKANLVAYVPQNEEIDWDFPVLVKDVVMMGRYGHMGFLKIPNDNDYEIVKDSLKKVGMLELENRQISELSGGQRKRVFLARALAQQSEIILMDEPFTGIDVNTEEEIMELLREMKAEGKVMLISTHNLGSVPEFCDRTILLNKTVLAEGETTKVFTQENLTNAFEGVLRRYVLSATELHNDDDQREVVVLSDDERPVVIYGDDEKAD
jgi:manganese/iron transport system ATP-binding protein|tara:strand:- start:649 stop:1491 length:843 start_codon:yes stop_codon:yes gene_type:complete